MEYLTDGLLLCIAANVIAWGFILKREVTK